MKITHICLGCNYIEGWGYQENILPKMHKKMGYDVSIIASNFAFNKDYSVSERALGNYINDNGISVSILKKRNSFFGSRLKQYDGLLQKLNEIHPDIVFVHGGQFLSLYDVITYCRNNPKTKLFIDQHGDYYNTPVSTLKKAFIHKVFFKFLMRKAVPYTERFWGVTPWRCEYLHDVYGIPKEKIGLLVMGGDDDYINFNDRTAIKKRIRNQFDLSDDDFVIISGGKIDRTKNIHLLMRAVSQLGNDKIKLFIFGQPDSNIKNEFDKLASHPSVRYLGWLKSTEVYDYFLASDLVFFPGTHSVLWEQAAACGIPMIVKDWEGMHHLDTGGNCLFLKNDSTEEYSDIINELYNNKERFRIMKDVAEKNRMTFSYKEIARKAISI